MNMIPEQVLVVLRALPIVVYVRALDAHETYVNIRSSLAKVPTVLLSKTVADLLRAPVNEEARALSARRFAVVEVQTVSAVDMEEAQGLVDQRFADDTDIRCAILVGAKPATEMIPVDMHHMVIPVDLTAPEMLGMDDRPRRNPATASQIEEEFRGMYGHLFTAHRYTGSLPSLDLFSGLNMIEIRHALSLTVVDRKVMDAAVEPISLEDFIDQGLIDSVRHRWGRVA